MSTQPTPLHIERIAPKTYVGRNARGAEVRIGSSDADGVFSPGELLGLALAACGLLSADHTIASRLGAEFAAVVDIDQTKPDGEDRYDRIAGTIRANLDALDAEHVAALQERAARAIERLCTVGHTLDAPPEHPVVLEHDASLPQQL
ncbi:OsmC family protein [Agrococcus sp. HG114]|uniref:OsmC family protein n=1 Tax=Agrococcus sp. HG114 TaxID=2969757 RepID=UPI00215ACB97|nr:OsmC family protein [Agrococcus sp. HG114]MCR8671513.1 OsmC family protein [Agrococcus sp. HG114]